MIIHDIVIQHRSSASTKANDIVRMKNLRPVQINVLSVSALKAK